MMRTAFITTALTLASNVEAADWNYDNDGADWATVPMDDNQCGMSEQSPIDIQIEELIHDPDLDLSFNYTAGTTLSMLMSTGKGLQINLNDEERTTHYVDYKDESYIAEQLHFHWGSENTLVGERFPLEMHIVHYNTNYESLGDALGEENGVLVVGVLFSHDESAENSATFDAIASVAGDMPIDEISGLSVDNFELTGLLPSDSQSYVTWPGSLTTPPCTEKVTWVLMRDQVHVSTEAIANFTRTEIFNTTEATNFREVQPLNGRTVHCSWEGCQASTSPSTSPSVDEDDDSSASTSPSTSPSVDEDDDSSAYRSSPAGLVAVLSLALAYFSW